VVSSLTTKRSITTSVVRVEDSRVVRGKGSAAIDSFDETLTRVREILLSPEFDGRYDPTTGLKTGNKTFTLIDKVTGTPFAPNNNQSIMITIDGVAQNPGYSYKINGNQITFYEAPLGKRQENVDGEIVDVPSQSYYIRGFEFRDDSDNDRYLKKLKDISNNFDGRTRIFDLFYEDGSIVKSDENENFLIYLNAVLQQGSYEIRRFKSVSKTDQIVFSKAPKNYDDVYEGVPNQLQNEEYFFGYSVGSYERLHINEKLIPFNTKTNSYQILDENNRIKNFDTPLYAYVFIDGVLQIDSISYKVNGPSIRFLNPLQYSKQGDGSYTTAKVDILYFYGKDYSPTVTLFDFEDDTFFNRSTVTFSGVGTREQVQSWYKLDSSNKTVVYQIVNGEQKVWGEVIDIVNGSGDSWQMYLRSQNVDMIDSESVYFSRKNKSGSYDTINVSFDSFSVEYLKSDQNERILNRVESNYVPFLNTTDLTDSYEYKGEIIREHPNLRVGDLIQIDGELETREVFSIPLFAKTREYRPGEQVSNKYFAKVNVSAYNKDFYGEGLSVTANINNGVVTSLNWNKRDLQQYFDNNISSNPTAYQYYSPPVLNFIPVEGYGGGAKAEVVVYGGQIIDLILVDGGSGYTKAPRVVVSRGYNVLRSNNYAESSFNIALRAQNDSVLGSKIISIVTDIPIWYAKSIDSVTTLVSPTPHDFKEILVCIVTPEPQTVTFGSTYPSLISSQVQKTIENNTLLLDETTIKKDIQLTEILSYATFTNPCKKYYQTGVLNMDVAPMGERSSHFTHGIFGGSVKDFIDSLYIDVGYFNVSGITIDELQTTYNEFASIADTTSDDWMENYSITDSNVTTTGRVLNFGIPSIHELMSYLDADLLIGQTTLYIPDTTNFPPQGTLLVGKELISYTQKFADRFVGLTRGVNGTTESDHFAGDLVRTIGLATTA